MTGKLCYVKHATPPFRTVALVGRPEVAREKQYFERIVTFLQKHHADILVDANVAPATPIQPTPRKIIAKRADLIIVFGGDGTYIRTVRELAGTSAVIFGVQLCGTLGFLTEHAPRAIFQHLQHFFAGKFKINERILLAITVRRGGKVVKKAFALNEAVLSYPAIARLVAIDLAMDGNPITRYLADGLIIATPTGSTAYSLSAGGPIVYPSLHSFVITPISPHMLTNRPIVVPNDRTLTTTIVDQPLLLTVDGQDTTPLRPGDEVSIQKADWVLRVIYEKNRNFFSVLRKKLNWGER